MPRGQPKIWTLEELQLIWTFDGSDGRTVSSLVEEMGITTSSWYGIRNRLQNHGGPEQLYEIMQKERKNRYVPAASGKLKTGPRLGHPLTLEDSLTRIYVIYGGNAGRGGAQTQYSVTIPPILAEAFQKKFGGFDFRWEPREDGLLIRPVPRVQMPELPDWVKEVVNDE